MGTRTQAVAYLARPPRLLPAKPRARCTPDALVSTGIRAILLDGSVGFQDHGTLVGIMEQQWASYIMTSSTTANVEVYIDDFVLAVLCKIL